MRGDSGVGSVEFGYITTGERVVSVVAVLDKWRGYGTAIRDEHDQWNPEIGFGLATGRALCDLGAALKREAWEQVPQRRDMAELERIIADLKRRDETFTMPYEEVDTPTPVWEDTRPWYERVLGHLFG